MMTKKQNKTVPAKKYLSKINKDKIICIKCEFYLRKDTVFKCLLWCVLPRNLLVRLIVYVYDM